MQIKIMGMSCSVELLIVSLVLGLILGCHMLCSCSKIGLVEGMQMLGNAPLNWKMGNGVESSWENKGESQGRNVDTNTGGSVPLPEGEMFFFSENKFDPTCCVAPKSGYSNSLGCACLTEEQQTFITQHGGNRTCGN
jgi:hypothetical protein